MWRDTPSGFPDEHPDRTRLWRTLTAVGFGLAAVMIWMVISERAAEQVLDREYQIEAAARAVEPPAAPAVGEPVPDPVLAPLPTPPPAPAPRPQPSPADPRAQVRAQPPPVGAKSPPQNGRPVPSPPAPPVAGPPASAPATTPRPTVAPVPVGAGPAPAGVLPQSDRSVTLPNPPKAPAVTPSPTPSPPPVPASVPTPSPAPAPAATRAPAASTTPARDSDVNAIHDVLDQYRRAFQRLDVSGIETFWPAVNKRALARAFEQLQSQSFRFDSCRINIAPGAGDRAEVDCQGAASFTPRVGDGSAQFASRQWTFRLSRARDRWIIDSVASR